MFHRQMARAAYDHSSTRLAPSGSTFLALNVGLARQGFDRAHFLAG